MGKAGWLETLNHCRLALAFIFIRFMFPDRYLANRNRMLIVDGFSIIENCFSRPECDSIIPQFDTISGGGTRCLLNNVWCQALASEIRNRVAKTIPELARLVAVQCTFFNKSPTSNWLVAFHQDRSIPVAMSLSACGWSGWSQKEGMTFIHGPDELLDQMIAVRLHFDDCTADNGPLRVIPGSHRAGTMSPEKIVAQCESSEEEVLLVSKGGVIAMRPLLIHASSKSRTIENRRVLHFLFGPVGLPAGLEWRLAV